MSTELKPCPFCGAKAHTGRDDEYGDTVSCSNQKCFNKMILHVGYWNTRTESTELEQLRADYDSLDKQAKQWLGEYKKGVEANKQLRKERDEARSAIEAAMRVEDLWIPADDVVDNSGEAAALAKMRFNFKDVLAKLKQGED